jgi:hypothetical protein
MSQQRDPIDQISADLDGFVWVRTQDGDLCGPYDSEQEARKQIRPCPRCDGYGLIGDDPSGQNLASCTLCDESGIAPDGVTTDPDPRMDK